MEMIPFEKFLLGTNLRFYLQRKFEAPMVLKDIPRKLPRCLEIGCGHGAGLLIIKQITGCGELIGIDMDPQMLKSASGKLCNPPDWAGGVDVAGIRVMEADASKMPFGDGHFDAVFLFDALHHIVEWRKVISEVFRVLKPGGIFSFEEAAISKSPLYLNDFLKHIPFGVSLMLEELERTGFVIEKYHKVPFLPYCFVRAVKPENR